MAMPSKTCATCGRTMEWRKSWERTWDSVKYCSKGCRAHRPDHTDDALESAIESLLDSRSRGASICPSEAARLVGGESWRDLLERSRQAARRLAAQGRVVITQGSTIVDPSTARGPIRIRRTA